MILWWMFQHSILWMNNCFDGISIILWPFPFDEHVSRRWNLFEGRTLANDVTKNTLHPCLWKRYCFKKWKIMWGCYFKAASSLYVHTSQYWRDNREIKTISISIYNFHCYIFKKKFQIQRVRITMYKRCSAALCGCTSYCYWIFGDIRTPYIQRSSANRYRYEKVDSFMNNSKSFVSKFLENFEKMFPWYHVHIDVFSGLKSHYFFVARLQRVYKRRRMHLSCWWSVIMGSVF